MVTSLVIAAAPAVQPAPARQRQAVSQPTTTRYPDAPAWIKEALSSLQKLPERTDVGSSGVSIPAEEELNVTAALEKAFGMPVTAVQGAKQAPAGTRGLILRLAVDSKTTTSWWLGEHASLHHNTLCSTPMQCFSCASLCLSACMVWSDLPVQEHCCLLPAPSCSSHSACIAAWVQLCGVIML